MQKVFENKEFIILKGHTGHNYSYILYNKKKDFSKGHTHISDYNTTRWILRLYQQRKIPYKLKSTYLLNSLLRISDDATYSKQICDLLKQKSN